MEGGPTTETDSNTLTNDEAVAAHANPDTITFDVREIMEDLIKTVNDPLPTIPNPLPAPGSRLASQRRIPSLSELFVYPEAGAANFNPLAFYHLASPCFIRSLKVLIVFCG
jgi:hypothetical protein